VTAYVGHGIGRAMHENPQVPNFVNHETRKSDFRLEPGLVLAVEPMVNMRSPEVKTTNDNWTVVTKDGLPSVHVEHLGRGGLVPAVYISHELQVPMLSIDHSSKVPGFADELLRKVADKSATGTRLLFVDDINDSGGTIVYIRNLLADNGCTPQNLRFAVLMDNCRSQARVDYAAEQLDRAEDKRWFVFPWEAVMTAETLVEEAQAVPERLG
jgi:xanthine phosphoribosyltransferase